MKIKQYFTIAIDGDTCISEYSCGNTHTCHLIGKETNVSFTFNSEAIGKLGELIATLKDIERELKNVRSKELAKEIANLQSLPILIPKHSNGNGNSSVINELQF